MADAFAVHLGPATVSSLVAAIGAGNGLVFADEFAHKQPPESEPGLDLAGLAQSHRGHNKEHKHPACVHLLSLELLCFVQVYVGRSVRLAPACLEMGQTLRGPGQTTVRV